MRRRSEVGRPHRVVKKALRPTDLRAVSFRRTRKSSRQAVCGLRNGNHNYDSRRNQSHFGTKLVKQVSANSRSDRGTEWFPLRGLQMSGQSSRSDHTSTVEWGQTSGSGIWDGRWKQTRSIRQFGLSWNAADWRSSLPPLRSKHTPQSALLQGRIEPIKGVVGPGQCHVQSPATPDCRPHGSDTLLPDHVLKRN